MKLRITNYQPYEYQLLQDLLDKMAYKNYYPKSIGFITCFYKEETKDHLVVDVFKAKSKDYEQKMKERQLFLDQYIDCDYQVMYESKNGLYVFYGQSNAPTPYLNNHEVYAKKHTLKYGILFLLSCIAIVVANTFSQSFVFTKVTTYGSYLMMYALTVLLFGFLYFSYTSFTKNYHFERTKFNKVTIKSKLEHILKTYIMIIPMLLIVLCLFEDLVNQKKITFETHPIIHTSDLKMSSDFNQYTVNRSFVTKSYYHLIETSNDLPVLDVREYQLDTPSTYYKQIKHDPTIIDCESIKEYNHYLIGTQTNTNNKMIIRTNSSIIIVNVMDNITDNQIKTILDYYKDK